MDLLKTLPYICDCQIRPGISQSVKCLVRLVCLVCLVESASLMLASRSSQLNLRRTSLESDPGYLSEESRCGLLPSNVDTRLKNKWQDSPQGRHGYHMSFLKGYINTDCTRPEANDAPTFTNFLPWRTWHVLYRCVTLTTYTTYTTYECGGQCKVYKLL